MKRIFWTRKYMAETKKKKRIKWENRRGTCSRASLFCSCVEMGQQSRINNFIWRTQSDQSSLVCSNSEPMILMQNLAPKIYNTIISYISKIYRGNIREMYVNEETMWFCISTAKVSGWEFSTKYCVTPPCFVRCLWCSVLPSIGRNP
jgi:hypothetical protein